MFSSTIFTNNFNYIFLDFSYPRLLALKVSLILRATQNIPDTFKLGRNLCTN